MRFASATASIVTAMRCCWSAIQRREPAPSPVAATRERGDRAWRVDVAADAQPSMYGAVQGGRTPRVGESAAAVPLETPRAVNPHLRATWPLETPHADESAGNARTMRRS